MTKCKTRPHRRRKNQVFGPRAWENISVTPEKAAFFAAVFLLYYVATKYLIKQPDEEIVVERAMRKFAATTPPAQHQASAGGSYILDGFALIFVLLFRAVRGLIVYGVHYGFRVLPTLFRWGKGLFVNGGLFVGSVFSNVFWTLWHPTLTYQNLGLFHKIHFWGFVSIQAMRFLIETFGSKKTIRFMLVPCVGLAGLVLGIGVYDLFTTPTWANFFVRFVFYFVSFCVSMIHLEDRHRAVRPPAPYYAPPAPYSPNYYPNTSAADIAKRLPNREYKLQRVDRRYDRSTERIHKNFEQQLPQFEILSVEKVENEHVHDRFETAAKKKTPASKIVWRFHGTAKVNVPGICEQGILTACDVSGGGTTIWSAQHSSYSLGYATKQGTPEDGALYMFYCRVLTNMPSKHNNNHSPWLRPQDSNGVTTVQDCAHICPEFLIKFRANGHLSSRC